MATILFIQDVLFEYFGPMYISSTLKINGHKCDLLVLAEEKNILEEIEKINPDAIFVSCMTGPHKQYIKFLSELKKRMSIPVVMGGPHPTFFPEVLKEDAIDYICIGEGESFVVDFANALDAASGFEAIPNLGWKTDDKECIFNPVRNFVANLDDLPFPDRQLYYKRYPAIEKYPTKRFLAARGCPYNCTFCFNHVYKSLYHGKGNYVRYRSLDNIIREIDFVRRNYRTKTVRFSDDTFTLDKKWLLSFLGAYSAEISLPFTCLVRANELDAEIVAALKKSGCVNVFFGLESGNEKIRNSLLKKNLTNEQIRNAASLLKENGIPFGTYNMLGFPGETLANVFETIALNQEICTDYPSSTILQPYPGTEVADYAIKAGYLSPDYDIDMVDSVINGSLLSIDQKMVNMNSFFYFACKFRFLMPVIKMLIKLSPNPLYRFMSLFSLGVVRLKSQNISVIDGLRIFSKYFTKI
jgi:anaerobic magnesium-protoporphyrin IX monomethyl ester cyclase